ncbi:MAG: hypothetical protein ACI8ZB_003223 [Desulforhopalus sp.]|jgi:hypothetical protein
MCIVKSSLKTYASYIELLPESICTGKMTFYRFIKYVMNI